MRYTRTNFGGSNLFSEEVVEISPDYIILVINGPLRRLHKSKWG